MGNGTRYRATTDSEGLQAVPIEAQDSEVPGRIHWAVVTEGDDPFIQGAYWGLHWSLTLVFGGLIGNILTELTLVNTEMYDGSQWVPVA